MHTAMFPKSAEAEKSASFFVPKYRYVCIDCIASILIFKNYFYLSGEALLIFKNYFVERNIFLIFKNHFYLLSRASFLSFLKIILKRSTAPKNSRNSKTTNYTRPSPKSRQRPVSGSKAP